MGNRTEYDLFSPEFKVNPFPTYGRMRRHDPVYLHVAPDGAHIWYITRYADVVAVLKDDVHFCKDPRNAQDHDARRRSGQPSEMKRLVNENMLFSDPPDHTRLRALVNQAFTRRRVDGLAEQMQQIASHLLDQVQNQAQMDLIADYALPFPVRVISALLGIPAADQEAVSDWSQAIISPGSRGLNYSARRRKVRALLDYLQQMFRDRATSPADDLVTDLVQAEEAGDVLNELELSSMVVLLLVTGHETTVNLIGNGALALMQHPDQLAAVQCGDVSWETAVEELLRFDGPVETSTTRWVREDHDFLGQPLRRGDVVRVVLSSANRDERQFAHPDRLDLSRTDQRHLAFGLGIHYCLGAPLARLEGAIALQSLFGRWPQLSLRVPYEGLRWRSGVLFRGLRELPIRW